VAAEATKFLDRYEYSHALGAVERFFFMEFCDNYLEIVKERFWTPEKFDAEVVEAARHTLYRVNRTILHLLAPFVPFVTEELYRIAFRPFGGAVSIHVSAWPEADLARVDADAVESGRLLIAVLTGARRWKTDRKVNQNSPLARLVVSAPDEFVARLRPLAEDLRAAAHAQTLDFAPGGDVETEIPEITLGLELAEREPA
jgi:valyl-tRNA synthetase